MKSASGSKRKAPVCSECNGQLAPPGHTRASCPRIVGEKEAAKRALKAAQKAAAKEGEDEQAQVDRLAELLVKHTLDEDTSVLSVLKDDDVMTSILHVFKGLLDSIGAGMDQEDSRAARRLSFGDSEMAMPQSPSSALPPRPPVSPAAGESPSKQLFDKCISSDSSRGMLKEIFKLLLQLYKGRGESLGHSAVTTASIRRHFGAELGDSVEYLLGVLGLTHLDSGVEQPLAVIRTLLAGAEGPGTSKPLPENISPLPHVPLQEDTLQFLLRDIAWPSVEKALSLSYIPGSAEKELYYLFLNLLEPLLACDKERKLRLAAASAEITARAIEDQGKRQSGAPAEVPAEETAADFELPSEAMDVEQEMPGTDSATEHKDKGAAEQEQESLRRSLKLWFEGYLRGSLSHGPCEFIFLTILPLMSLLGCLEAKLHDADFLQALPQLIAELCAIIEITAKLQKVGPDQELSAFGILSNFKLWFIVRFTRVRKEPSGEWKTRIETAGPYQLFDIRTGQLHPDARELLSHLCNLLMPSMQKEPRKVWKEKTQLFNSYAYQRAGERVDKMDHVDLEKQQLKEHVTQLESDLKRAWEEKEQAEKRAQEEKAQAERREKELSARIAALEAASLAKLS